jgi:hypothetical protein
MTGDIEKAAYILFLAILLHGCMSMDSGIVVQVPSAVEEAKW